MLFSFSCLWHLLSQHCCLLDFVLSCWLVLRGCMQNVQEQTSYDEYIYIYMNQSTLYRLTFCFWQTTFTNSINQLATITNFTTSWQLSWHCVCKYCSVPGKRQWALKHNLRFWPAWAFTRDITAIRLYRSCCSGPLKCATWALSWDTTICVHVWNEVPK